MKTKSLKIPAIIISIGLIIAIAAHFFTSVCQKPTVEEQDFDFSVTYKLDGETKTLSGVYTCRFVGFGNEGIDPLCRYYDGEYTIDGAESSRTYKIAEKGTVGLYIVMLFNDSYLMGDTEHESYHPSLSAPELEAVDKEGYTQETYENEFLEMFDAEIISWEYPEPIENSFVFAGFAGFHTVSTIAMVGAGLLTLILCMVFVKKSSDVTLGVLDVFGVILNFGNIIVVLPVIFIVAVMIQAFPTGPDWIYQADLLIPPIIPFTVAASVSLRRKGFRKSGFFIQFLAVVIMVILSILEYVL